jgi:hypothetical protein
MGLATENRLEQDVLSALVEGVGEKRQRPYLLHELFHQIAFFEPDGALAFLRPPELVVKMINPSAEFSLCPWPF